MPTIVFKTRIRTTSESFTLDLVVSHHLVAGEPSATPLVLKNPPPQGVDIVLVSPLIITTTGMLNNRRISADSLKSSRIALHLVEYLKLVVSFYMPVESPLTLSRIPASLGSKSSPMHTSQKTPVY